MKVADLLERRLANWRELEALCGQVEGRRVRHADGAVMMRFARLYRAACADLALADAYQLPPETVRYLHRLVGRAHNVLYRLQKFDLQGFLHHVLFVVPKLLFADNFLRLCFLIFWVGFLGSMGLAATSPAYRDAVIGEDQMTLMRQGHSASATSGSLAGGGIMTGFYIRNNAGIGLQCFVFGAIFAGVGGLFVLVFNAVYLGAVFGFFLTVSEGSTFYEFVTAHGPFELNAVVLSAAAGLKLGMALVMTGGLKRGESWVKAAKESLPTIMAAVLLFVGAAFIEAFVSPSPWLPYEFKALVAVITSALLMFYFVMLGWPREVPIGAAPKSATDPWADLASEKAAG